MVGIDLTQIPHEKVGVGTYATEFIRSLYAEAAGAYTVFVRADDPDFRSASSASVRWVHVNRWYFRTLAARVLWEQLILPVQLLSHKCRVLHSIHYSFPLLAPLLGIRVAVTMHDASFFLFPQVHSKLKVVYFRLFSRLAAKLADVLIFDSHAAHTDLRAVLGGGIADRSRVVHLGVSEGFGEVPSEPELSTVWGKYGIRSPYILYVGTVEPRKNVGNLVAAYRDLRGGGLINHNLVIVGKSGWMSEDVFQVTESNCRRGGVVFTGYVPREDVRILMHGCDVFVYPSSYEGFGLPVLEAMKCGKPIVTTASTAMQEIVGDCGVLIPSGNRADISDGIMECLRMDTGSRSDLGKRARERAEHFTWKATRRQTVEVYQQLLESQRA